MELRLRPGHLLGDAEYLFGRTAMAHHRLGFDEGLVPLVLPDLPEHRRLGYRPPRDPAEFVVLSEDGTPIRPKGVMSWFQSKMEEAQAQQAARQGRGNGRRRDRGNPDQIGAAARQEDEQEATGQVSCRIRWTLRWRPRPSPAKTNGHSAKNAPKRTRSTRKTTQSG